MRNVSLPLALCSALFLPAACSKGPEKDPARKDVATKTTGLRQNAGSGQNILVSQDLARLFPGDAIAVGAFAGPERFFKLFGRDEIVSKLGPRYEEAVGEVRELTGQDLLSASGLAAFGVDPSQPIGVFYWSLEQESGGAFVGLSDREKFLSSVRAVAERAKQTLETHEEGGATILCPEHDTQVCLIVTSTHAYVAGSSGGSDVGLQIAKRLAALTKDKSMASNQAFDAAIGKLERGVDMAGYLNLEPIVALTMGELGTGATPREQGQAVLMREILGPLRAVAFGGDFDPRAFTAQAFVHTQGSSLLTKLARNGTRVNPVVRAMGEDAVLLGTYNLDPVSVFDFARKIAAAEGEDLGKALAEAKALTGFDIEADLLLAFSGEFGVGMEADMAKLMSGMSGALDQAGQGDDLEAKLLAAADGVMTIGFTDAAKGKALVERILGTPPISAMVTRDDKLDLWRLPTPVGKTLLFSVAAPADGSAYLVVASSEALLTKVKDGTAAPAFSGHASNEDYVKFIGDADVAALYSFRQASLGMAAWLGLASGRYMDERTAEPGDANETAEHRQKREALDQVRAQLAEIRRAEDTTKSTMLGELFRPWGVTAASMKVAPDGWDLRMGQFIDAPWWAALAGGLVDSAMTMANASREQAARQAELYAKESELEMEIMQMELAGAEANDVP